MTRRFVQYRSLQLLCTALLLGSSPAAAQILLPLDSRPATSTLPAQIAGLISSDVRLAPHWLLGVVQQSGDDNAMQAWLAAQIAPESLRMPMIVSLDALAYGGLVQSRTSTISAETALARLQILKTKAAEGQPIYAFITLPRSPDATDRPRNLAVVQQMIAWAAEGVFKELHVTWDDALPGSPAPQEGAVLVKTAPEGVLIYPGADEVLSSLVARATAPLPALLRVEYSSPKTADSVIKYEGIALSKSVALHAQATGFNLMEGQTTAPMTLYVYNGGDTRKAALRISALLRLGKVAVADVASVNKGTPALWRDLMTLRRPVNLAALAAWGTPGNNIGTALAHAKVYLEGADPLRQDALLAREYANDVIYSAQLRDEVRKALPEQQLGTPEASQVALKLAQPDFPLRLGQSYTLQDPAFPWNRSFEWQFELKPLP